MKPSALFNLVILLLWLPNTNAADVFDLGAMTFNHISKKSDSILTVSLAQGKNGMIYIGGQKTIHSYDGYNFHPLTYTNETGEISRDPLGYIIRLRVAPNGDLWAATLRDGLLHYDVISRKLIRYTKDASAQRRISSNRVDDILFHNGGVWIATNSGLDRLNLENGRISRNVLKNHGLGENAISAMAIDDDNTLWLGISNHGLYYSDDFGSKWHRPEFAEDIINPEKIRVYSFYADSKNSVWVGSRKNSLFRIQNKTVHVVNQRIGTYVGFAEPFKNEMWVTVSYKGIQVYDLSTGEFLRSHRHNELQEDSIAMDDLSAMLIDESGVLWIGTRGNGINTLNTRAVAYRSLSPSNHSENSINAKNVRSVLVRKNGQIWVSYSAYGIDVIDPKLGVIQTFHRGKDNLAQSPNWLAETWDGKVLIGNEDMPQRYDEDTKKFVRASSFELDNYYSGKLVATNLHGELLLSGSPVLRYEPRSDIWNIIDNPELKKNVDWIFNCYTSDTDGNFWVSDRSKIFFLARGASEFSVVNALNEAGQPLKHGQIRQLHWSRRNTLYMNAGKKIYVAEPESDLNNIRFRQLTTVPFESTFAETEDLKLLGIWNHFNPLTDQELNLYKGYGQANIGDWSFKAKSTLSGTILFSAPKGIHLFKPSLFELWDYQPPVVVTQIALDGQQLNPRSESIELTPNQDRIQVRFSSLDYTSPESNQYRFRLHGYDKKWQFRDADSRLATYNNLAPGDYTLEIHGTNRVGEWSPRTKSLQLTVLPSWHQTWWAKCVFFVACVMFLYIAYRLRIQQLKAREALLSTMVENKTHDLEQSLLDLKEMQAKLVASEKHASLGRLIRGVAHELNTPLGVIKMSFSMLYDKINEHFDTVESQRLTSEAFAKTRAQVEKTSSMLDKNLDRTIDLISSFKRVSVEEDQAAMQWFFLKDLLEKTMTDLSVDLQLDVAADAKFYNDKTAFTEVFAELLKNAQRHHIYSEESKDKIRIELDNYNIEENKARIRLIDKGPGVDDQYLEKIFDPFFTINDRTDSVGLGLHIVYNKLTQRLNGTIRAKSSDPQGLTMIIDVCIENSDSALPNRQA